MIKIKWQNKEGEWVEFPMEEILGHSRDHAIALFSRDINVIIKQDEEYIVNNRLLLKQYLHNKKKVRLLADIAPNSGNLKSVGFIYG